MYYSNPFITTPKCTLHIINIFYLCVDLMFFILFFNVEYMCNFRFLNVLMFNN